MKRGRRQHQTTDLQLVPTVSLKTAKRKPESPHANADISNFFSDCNGLQLR